MTEQTPPEPPRNTLNYQTPPRRADPWSRFFGTLAKIILTFFAIIVIGLGVLLGVCAMM